MSQIAVLVRVDGVLIEEVFSSVPDHEELVEICRDNGFDGTEDVSDHYLVEYEWIDIGEGESGMDTFIDDETLLAIYDSYDYAEYIQKTFGLGVEVVESGSDEIMFLELD